MDPNWPSDPASLRSRLPDAKPVPELSGNTRQPGSIGKVLARLSVWLTATIASAIMLIYSEPERHPLFDPDPVVPDNAGRSLLVWGTIFFVLSVLPLIWPGAPRTLRVFGVLYAMLGAWLLAGTWLG